jgi:two-component system catabolic regulation response regulator CreB
MTAATLLFTSALLVEDELHLADTLKIAMRKLKIPVRHATTLESARTELRLHTAEFILLDRALPDGDGLDLCRELRENGYAGTVLVLTASGQTEDRVRGLNAGADDYLSKPFSWEELEARIRALSRRRHVFAPLSTSAAHSTTEKPLWKMDQDRLKICGNRGWVELTPLEFKLASKPLERLSPATNSLKTYGVSNSSQKLAQWITSWEGCANTSKSIPKPPIIS